MAFCTYCGNELAEDASNCRSCGHPATSRGVATVAGQADGYAIASLVAAIAGLTIVPLLGSILGVVFGRTAQKRIEANPGLAGEGLARAGVIIGSIGIGVFVVGVVIMALFIAALSGMSF